MRPGEAGDEGIGGPAQQVARRAQLQQAATGHHAHAVGQGQRLAVVVGDVERAEAMLAHNAADEVAQFLAQSGVQIGQRLVAQQQPRTHRQRACQRHPLLLPARQRMRMAPGQVGKAHVGEHGAGAVTRLRATHAVQRQGDVVQRAQVRPQRVVLEHHAELALLRRQEGAASLVDHRAAKAHAATVQPFQTRHQPQQRGLARPGRAEQAENLALLQLQAEIVQRGGAAEALARGVDVQEGHVAEPSCRQAGGVKR
ncbi:hypothetical protein GALL_478660 [mine drainage metagenome]|uniref:Uncharacterized protein n=1 Tax=mine drainage metagenome TaxID=410659 RepID=A0A1J5PH28_9ZZZZ